MVALKVHTGVNGDVPVVSPPGHSCHKLSSAEVDVFVLHGVKVCPDVLEIASLLDVGTPHQGCNVLFPVSLLALAFKSPPLRRRRCFEWSKCLEAHSHSFAQLRCKLCWTLRGIRHHCRPHAAVYRWLLLHSAIKLILHPFAK